MVQKELKLKVAEAVQDDVNKGIVRIDTSFMHQIGIRPGDIVDIEGEGRTVCIADRAYPGDIGLNIIRMDGLVRRNAKTGIGETVKVRKADVKEAKRVILAPARKGIVIRASSDLFKQGLLGRALVKGDILSLGGTTRRRTTLTHSPFEDIFRMIDEDVLGGFGFGDIKFMVVDTLPKQAVIVSDLTEIVFNPEAVEVLEEKTIEVTYEDIGGLREEMQKVREMVELPLKHPEIFERLGIEAPKGVLLHGPPGTGKTLLAKAVANETNAHFILINGPEIMCVDGNTKIMTNPKGIVKAKNIFQRKGKRNKDKNNYEVLTLDKPVKTYSYKNGRLKKSKITHVVRLKAEAYKVKLSDGSALIVSANQPFLVYEQGKLVWKRISKLTKGDFIAKVNKLKINGQSKKINFKDLKLRLVKNSEGYAIKSRNLSRSNFIKLPEKTSPRLMMLIGLMFSDGNIEKDYEAITFANNDKKLRDYFKKIVANVFSIKEDVVKEYKDGRVVIYSKLLAKYFELLGVPSGNKSLKEQMIPAYLYLLPKEQIEAFVAGYFEGDGTASLVEINGTKEKITYPTPKIYCKSKNFLQEMQSLLQLRLGISTKINLHRTPKSKMFELVIRGYEGRKLFKKLPIVTKKDKLSPISKVTRQKQFMNIPFPKLLVDNLRKKVPYSQYRNHDYYVYGNGRFTKHALNRLYNIASKNKVVTPKINQEYATLKREGIAWEYIKDIQPVGEKELYDFTVDDDSFVAHYYLLHNSKFYGQSEMNLRKKFEEAEKNAPSIIFIDEIDAIASKREEVHGEVERRVVAQLLALMDGLKSRGKVVVIAASNVPNLLDPALRRPGRFDREIEIGVPGKEGRLDILKIHTRNMPLSKDVSLKELAAVTHGFVGADLAALSKEAAMIVLRKVLPDLKLKEDEPIPKELLEKLRIKNKDFKEALKVVRPSAMREVLVEVPNIKWTNIGGLEGVKQELKEAVEWPIKNPEGFKRLGITPPKGILLYGAPGTGKTLLAKAVATESEANFILVKGPELLSKWVGESEKAVREIFKKARQTAPTIIFFDEIDSLAPKRGLSADSHVTERVVNQLLTEMDGLEDLYDVVVIAATNRPDMLDSALLRPGRFDRLILTPVPDEKARLEVFKVHTKGMPIKGVSLETLAQKTDGYAGADMQAVCREAAILALRKDMKTKTVTKKDFDDALLKVSPSITKEIEEAYQNFTETAKKVRAKALREEKPAYMG